MQLTLNLTKDESQSPATITTDHPGKAAALAQNDSLAIVLSTNWASTDGITRVDFYTSETLKDANSPSTVYWTPTGQTGVSSHLSLSPAPPASTPVTTLTVTHTGTVPSDVGIWYKITAGGLVLDPELVNKSGTGGTGWVDKD